MGQALFNVPQFTDKRLFLLSDTQSRIKEIGPEAQSAFNLILRSFDAFTRTDTNIYYADRNTGLLVAAQPNIPRREVSGMLLEPEQVTQWVRNTEDFDFTVGGSPWTSIGSPVISSQTETAPTGIGLSADQLTATLANDSVTQNIEALFDPGVDNHRFSLFIKPVDPTPPDVRLQVDFAGGTPVAVFNDFVIDPNSDWLRYDLNALNPDVSNLLATVTIKLLSTGSVAIWGANFTAGSITHSYRARALEAAGISGEEHMVYDIDAMGIEPATNQDFTVIWDFVPIAEQGFQAPQISLVGGDSNGGPVPLPPALYNKALSFGAHTTLTTDKLAVVDSTPVTPVVYASPTDYNWTRYSHQKWAFAVYWDGGSQKIRFFANGTFLGETIATPVLTADNYTKFAMPAGALHRRIEVLAERLSDEAITAATTIT
jgi:hypothetical protein